MKEINARLNRLAKIANFLSSLTEAEFKIVQYAVEARAVNKMHKRKRSRYHRDKIPDKKVREVMELRANGVSFKEAARITGIKLGTINTAYFRKRVEQLLVKIPSDNRKTTY